MDAWLVSLIGLQMAFVVAVVAIFVYFVNARAQRRAELQARILDKFDSPESLGSFLASDEGRGLLEFLVPPRRRPGAAFVSAVKAAVVLLFLGAGFLVAGTYVGSEELTVPSFLCIGLSIGIFAAGFVGRALGSSAEPDDLQVRDEIERLTR